jgi:hypothetical protein
MMYYLLYKKAILFYNHVLFTIIIKDNKGLLIVQWNADEQRN